MSEGGQKTTDRRVDEERGLLGIIHLLIMRFILGRLLWKTKKG